MIESHADVNVFQDVRSSLLLSIIFFILSSTNSTGHELHEIMKMTFGCKEKSFDYQAKFHIIVT